MCSRSDDPTQHDVKENAMTKIGEYIDQIPALMADPRLVEAMGGDALYLDAPDDDPCVLGVHVEDWMPLGPAGDRYYCVRCGEVFDANPREQVHEALMALAPDPEPERRIGGWVHLAATGTLPTFTTHQGVYAALPVKE